MNTVNPNRTRWTLTVGSALLAAIALSGCRVGPHYNAPAPPTITAPNFKESTVNFHDAEGWKVASPQDAMIRGNWWEVFNEPELNALEEELNANNQNIKVSFNNFMAARAVIAQARSQYWPTVTAGASWNRSKSSGNLHNTSVANTGSTGTLWSIPVDVTWTPDFWGKIRNEVRETEYAAQASAADLQLEKLTEQAALAQYYFEIRGQDMLQSILNETVEADKKSLDATQGSYDVGVGDYISVVEAKATLQSAQSSAINVGLLRAQYEHAIAMLVGKVPTDFSIPVKPMTYTPPTIPTGMPSQLVERRPDVASAERTLAAANATIGIGYGAFFPQVTLSAAGGFESSTFKHLFDIPSRFWSLGPSVSQTLFNGWLYRAQLHQYQAIYNADLATYRQAVLTSFQQVEDSLSSTRIYSQQILAQQQAVEASRTFLDLEQERYKLGVDPYVTVVIAQTAYLNSQVELNTLHVQEMLSAVQLVQALGGGWDRSQLPTPQQAGAKQPNSAYTTP
ncbi:efflux transporter outer membrane subunit [Occallatibacter riparius]|uniref:Efflux transporter outer membrane subunit n=1 Tax=Occallatibacter riparius TaxID=1002689 RepID=A0A9J7BLW9_9BACT|nr:efflux transporter outer membrane subunit [Occallatibacter riparius]UWZ83481.1 efflux transporter outer membrane subunit [Occallatibacter riparius]